MNKFLIIMMVFFSFAMCDSSSDDSGPQTLGDIVKINILGDYAAGGGSSFSYIHKISATGEDLGAISNSFNAFLGTINDDVELTESIADGEYFCMYYNGGSAEETTRTYTFYNESDDVVCTKVQTLVCNNIIYDDESTSGDEYTEFKHGGTDIVLTQKIIP